MKHFRIAQKTLQTDWYEIMAENQEEALQIYNETSGLLMSSGSTSGWIGDDSNEVVCFNVFTKELED